MANASTLLGRHNGVDIETQHLLLANDPTVIDVFVPLCDDGYSYNDDDRYVASLLPLYALCASTHIQRLSLSFDLFNAILDRTIIYLQQTNATLYGTMIEGFLRWCSKRGPSLIHLRLECILEQSRQSNLALLPTILGCLYLRPFPNKLEGIFFCNIHVTADDLTTLLSRTAEQRPLKHLSLKYCVILSGSFATNVLATRHVAQCFRRVSCHNLSLGVDEENQTYICAILEALQDNTSIERLKLWNHYEDFGVLPLPIVHAIADLFRKAFGLWRVVALENFSLNDGVMAILVQALKASSMMLDKLRLANCRLDKAAIQELQSLYSRDSVQGTSSTTLHALALSGCLEFDANVTPSVLQDLVESSSGLHELHISLFDHCRQDRQHFAAIMNGLTSTKCAVTKLYIPEMRTRNMMTLIQAIPLFTSVTHAYFTFACDTKFKSRLLNAFRLNRSLVKTRVNVESGSCFVPDDIARLRNYNRRNKYLPRFLQWETMTVVKEGSRGGGKLVPSLLAVSTLLDAVTSDSSTMGTIHNVAALVGMRNHTGPTI